MPAASAGQEAEAEAGAEAAAGDTHDKTIADGGRKAILTLPASSLFLLRSSSGALVSATRGSSEEREGQTVNPCSQTALPANPSSPASDVPVSALIPSNALWESVVAAAVGSSHWQ